MAISKPLAKEQIEELADKIYQLFRKQEMWGDVHIYFNGNCLNNIDHGIDHVYAVA